VSCRKMRVCKRIVAKHTKLGALCVKEVIPINKESGARVYMSADSSLHLRTESLPLALQKRLSCTLFT
jgi:hypothetical protein